jgi:hypothetical protein
MVGLIDILGGIVAPIADIAGKFIKDPKGHGVSILNSETCRRRSTSGTHEENFLLRLKSIRKKLSLEMSGLLDGDPDTAG